MKARKLRMVIGLVFGLILLSFGNLLAVTEGTHLISLPDDMAVVAGFGILIGLFPLNFLIIYLLTKLVK